MPTYNIPCQPQEGLQLSLTLFHRFFACVCPRCIFRSSSARRARQSPALHDKTLAPGRGFTRILTLLNLPNHQLKRLLHVLVVARAGLGPAAVQLCGKGLAVVGRDLALFGSQIRLVSDDDERDGFGGLWERVSCLRPRRRAEQDCTDACFSTSSK